MFMLPAYLADWKLPSTYHVRTSYPLRTRTYLLQEVTGGADDQSLVAAAAGRSCGRPAGPSYRRHRPAVPAAWPACGAHRGGTQGAARPWSEDVPAQNSLFSFLRYSRKQLCSGFVVAEPIRGSVQKPN